MTEQLTLEKEEKKKEFTPEETRRIQQLAREGQEVTIEKCPFSQRLSNFFDSWKPASHCPCLDEVF